jgi:hypothetical protein
LCISSLDSVETLCVAWVLFVWCGRVCFASVFVSSRAWWARKCVARVRVWVHVWVQQAHVSRAHRAPEDCGSASPGQQTRPHQCSVRAPAGRPVRPRVQGGPVQHATVRAWSLLRRLRWGRVGVEEGGGENPKWVHLQTHACAGEALGPKAPNPHPRYSAHGALSFCTHTPQLLPWFSGFGYGSDSESDGGYIPSSGLCKKSIQDKCKARGLKVMNGVLEAAVVCPLPFSTQLSSVHSHAGPAR